MYEKTVRAVATLLTDRGLVPLATPTGPTEALDCKPPESLVPLIELLHTLTELAFLAGVGLGVLGFSVSALFLMLPGEDNTRRGKKVAKNVLFGVILLLSANMIVGFLVNELGGVICS